MQPEPALAVKVESGEPAKSAATGPSGDGPYVGPRPFERNEHRFFFGRERDAGFIRDKIFAARLTLLYAPSGTGKSSVLRTSIIPKLEEEGALPVYFDAWTSENPVDVLRDMLATLAAEVGVSNAQAGAPTLAELVRLINSTDGRTVVLILDQFDEMLLAHATRLNPIKRELGALVRAAGIDARVLISLRQEFLAGLEPFRSEILGLFGSTYLLGPLDESSVREAIEKPAAAMGVPCEAELSRLLIEDLDGSRSESGERGVDLPMLQIVCAQIWKAMVRSRGTALTANLYRQLGGTQRILESYVAQVMPRAPKERRLVARAMQFLAPRSGYKMSYSVEDLAAVSRIASKRLGPALQRLVDRRILRARAFRTGPRYELQHDSLIRLIGPWRDAVLAAIRRRQLILGGLGFAAIVALLSVAGLYYVGRERLEFYAHAEAPLEKLASTVDSAKTAATFDRVASYAVWQCDLEDRFEEIRRVLQLNQEKLPKAYGLPPLPDVRVEESQRSPLKVRFSSLRHLDSRRFAAEWKELAAELTARLGIPVPARVELIESPAIPLRQMKVEMEGAEPLALKVPLYKEDQALIKSVNLAPPAQAFFDRFEGQEWTQARDMPAMTGGSWYLVPRWSLPVWSASGVEIIDSSSAVAVLLAMRLLDKPDLLLTPVACERLLDHTARIVPHVVEEARASRGEHLREDLIELLRRGRRLSRLERVLDDLARYPSGSSRDVAEQVDRDLATQPLPAPERAIGPHRAEGANRFASEISGLSSTSEAIFHETEQWLPIGELRANIGQGLVDLWVADGKLKPALTEQIDTARLGAFARSGIWVYGVKFRFDRSLRDDEFQIQLPWEESPEGPAVATSAQSFGDALRRQVEASPASWVSADFTADQLKGMQPAERDWISRRYSITDLKLMLREALIAKARGGDVPRTIRHTRWLLRSLVFWVAAEGATPLAALGARLAETEYARLHPGFAHPSQAAEAVRRGINLLAVGRPGEAHQEFAAALGANRAGAIGAFLQAYPGMLVPELVASSKTCRSIPTTGLSFGERSDVTELVAKGTVSESEDLRLRLCLFDDAGFVGSIHKQQVAADLLSRHGDPAAWEAPDAWRFGLWMMDNPVKVKGRPDAFTWLLQTFSRMSTQEAIKHFDEQATDCSLQGYNERCWSWLSRLAEWRREDMVAPYANVLSSSTRLDDLERAQAMIDAAVSADPQRQIALQCARMTVHNSLAIKHRRPLGPEDQELLAMLTERGTCGGGFAHIMVQSLLVSGRLDEAAKAADQFLARASSDSALWFVKFQIALERGDQRLVQDIVAEVRKLAADPNTNPDDASGLLMVESFGDWLTGAEDWEHSARRFLGTDSPYAPFIAMILAASMVQQESREDAMQALSAWKDLDERAQRARLREGDERAWRELLIGCYLGKVSWSGILSSLETQEAFEQSDFSHTRFSREAMLADVLFYKSLWDGANNRKESVREDLARVVDLGQRQYLEYTIAKYLLRNIEAVQ
jgi:hypothetical protein